MGTKRPSCTLFDTLPNINTSDRKLQPGGKISRDPSPRPAMTAQSERERDRREEEWRREREAEKMRDKARYKDVDPRERYSERDRAPVPRPRERDRRQDDRRTNVKSYVEKESEREVEKGLKKGDTFPRMRKNSRDRDRVTYRDEDRGDRRPKRAEADDERWERDRERARQSRAREEETMTRRRPADDMKPQQLERHRSDVDYQGRRREGGETWERRDRDADRKREKPRSNMEKWEPRRSSPHRGRDREHYADRRDRGKPPREGRRDARSEGDSQDRDMRRERQRSRERERAHQHSRSEGDNTEGEQPRRKGGKRDDRRGSDDRREDDRNREHKQRRDRETKERRADHRWDDTTGRGGREASDTTPRVPPRAQSSGEWSSDMDSETRHRRGRDSYEDGTRDGKERRNPERAREREQERHERQERGGGREIAGSLPEQRRMWLEPQRGKNSKEVDRERGTRGEERGMELKTEWEREGRREKEEPDERYMGQSSYRGGQGGRHESREEKVRETEGVSVDGEDVRAEAYLSDSDGGPEGGRYRDEEGKRDTEESDREEEGGSDYSPRSGSEGGSDRGWRRERNRPLSGEDGFETVSSGGADEEEEYEECQEFLESGVREVRKEEWTLGKEDKVDDDEAGREKKSKYVFCVIGQTLPRSKDGDTSASQADQKKGVERHNPNLESSHHSSDTTQQPQGDMHLRRNDEFPNNSQDMEGKRDFHLPREERASVGETAGANNTYRVSPELQNKVTGEGMSGKAEHPYAEVHTIKRDSQTERLLIQWREKNKEGLDREGEQDSPVPSNPYADVFSGVDLDEIQPILDEITAGTMSPEEVEAIRIRFSGAWSLSDESKRKSQAPHLKWAKDVVREILGRSEEKVVDESIPEAQSGTANQGDPEQAEVSQGSGEMLSEEVHSEPELEVELLGKEGMGQSQAYMHADQRTAMHGDTPTYTHADTHSDTVGEDGQSVDKQPETCDELQLGKANVEVKVSKVAEEKVRLSKMERDAIRDKEEEMYLSVSNTLYKPSSCPILNYETGSDHSILSDEDEGQEGGSRRCESEEERQVEVAEERVTTQEEGQVGVLEGIIKLDGREGEVVADGKRNPVGMTSCSSFRDLGAKARSRRRGIRRTTERRKKGDHVDKEDEGVGRDRRTRIFSTTDDEDENSKTWGEVDLGRVLDTINNRPKRNSRFFNAAQLYQQYSEAAQNFEILRQSRSDAVSVSEDSTQSPAPSPPPARRPLPPLPSVCHPSSISHTGSITSVRSLPLPEIPRTGGRPPSPRLSVCLSQSPTLWRELPTVRNSVELEELTEDQRKLQEVRFEVVTSEASYCRSLDIVVEHFVKSKQLGALLTSQDRNWLFSRLADVRAISHSFLSKLEERVESDTMNFTVCDIISRHCQRFRMVYVPYLTNQSYQDATYQRLMNENAGFRRIVEKLERSPVCQRLPLRSFLVLPFQRITRIKLLVQNIVKKSTPGTPEATQAIKTLKLLEKLIQESNDSITQMKSIESLVSLSAKVDFECKTLPLISKSRYMVREGPVTELMDFSLKDTERSIYLHLFNDYLLLSLQKEGGRFTVIDHSPVSDLRAENCRVKLHSLQKNLFRLHMASKALLLRTDTQSDKLRWISALSKPHPEIDFSAAQDFPQMQCIKASVAQQPDEMSLDKADVILVHQQSSDHWVEGTRLSDRHRGWVPESHLETISNSRVRQRNLADALKLSTAKAAV